MLCLLWSGRCKEVGFQADLFALPSPSPLALLAPPSLPGTPIRLSSSRSVFHRLSEIAFGICRACAPNYIIRWERLGSLRSSFSRLEVRGHLSQSTCERFSFPDLRSFLNDLGFASLACCPSPALPLELGPHFFCRFCFVLFWPGYVCVYDKWSFPDRACLSWIEWKIQITVWHLLTSSEDFWDLAGFGVVKGF